MRDLEYLDPEKCRIVHERRQKLGLYQYELAKLIDVTPSHFSRIARGHAPCSPELRRKLEDALKLKPNSLSPAYPSRTCNGFVFGSPLPLNQPNDIIGPEVDDILATLPPEMRPLAAHLVLKVVSEICSVIKSALQPLGNDA